MSNIIWDEDLGKAEGEMHNEQHTSAWEFNGEWYANATHRQDTAVGPFPTRAEAEQHAEDLCTALGISIPV